MTNESNSPSIDLEKEEKEDEFTLGNEIEYVFVKTAEDVEIKEWEVFPKFRTSTLFEESEVNESRTSTAIRDLFKSLATGVSFTVKAYYSGSRQTNQHDFWVVIDEENLDIRQQFYDIEYKLNNIFENEFVKVHVIDKESDPDLSQIPDRAENLNLMIVEEAYHAKPV